MIVEGALNPCHVKMLILDEVDVMLSRGFEEQVREIFKDLPEKDLQAIAVTATLPPEVLSVSILHKCKISVKIFNSVNYNLASLKN